MLINWEIIKTAIFLKKGKWGGGGFCAHAISFALPYTDCNGVQNACLLGGGLQGLVKVGLDVVNMLNPGRHSNKVFFDAG